MSLSLTQSWKHLVLDLLTEKWLTVTSTAECVYEDNNFAAQPLLLTIGLEKNVGYIPDYTNMYML